MAEFILVDETPGFLYPGLLEFITNPKMNISEYGFVAHFEDYKANRVALHSRQ